MVPSTPSADTYGELRGDCPIESPSVLSSWFPAYVAAILAVVFDFVLVLSRLTVLVLYLPNRVEYLHEHHFIEHEYDIRIVPKCSGSVAAND